MSPELVGVDTDLCDCKKWLWAQRQKGLAGHSMFCDRDRSLIGSSLADQVHVFPLDRSSLGASENCSGQPVSKHPHEDIFTYRMYSSRIVFPSCSMLCCGVSETECSCSSLRFINVGACTVSRMDSPLICHILGCLGPTL